MHMFDWEDMHYFTVFADSKSLSAAARLLAVDHATVARRIAALEKALALKLVDRRPRAYSLTLDGERIAALGQSMTEDAFAVLRLAKAGQQTLAGEVSISIAPSIAAEFVVPFLGQLRQQYPAIHLRMIAETRMASLPHGEADIIVRIGRLTDESLVVRKVRVLPFAFYATAEYVARVAPEDYVFIAFDESLDGSEQFGWLKNRAAGRDIVFRSNSIDIQRIAAAAGVGVVLLPQFLAAKSDLQRLDEVEMQREVWLAVHTDLRHTPVVRAVLDFLSGCFNEA
jgi:DNA-binding transcriptional LysR family regulator